MSVFGLSDKVEFLELRGSFAPFGDRSISYEYQKNKHESLVHL